MPRLLSCKLSDDLYTRLETEAEQYKLTITDVTKKILEFYFTRDQRQQNMDMIMAKLDRLEFENAKTRALWLQAFDPEGTKITDSDIEKVEKLVRAYLEKKD